MAQIARKLVRESAATLPIVEQASKKKTLPELLSVFPRYGVGQKVLPNKWIHKGFRNHYIEVTRVRFRNDSLKLGKAWGHKYWNGKLVDDGKELQIRGWYKWYWLRWPIKDEREAHCRVWS
ncbi:7195_t:CDS:2 [Ambispora leptoticha]|uniref:7195_t:CDS:1 n=1 Tax=Ambispora leptoticha TaxID=144679 RepID=A0A9N8VWA9_9GLOM|nr:7195_t:CDS:2 [Ambispora leptoticha]